MKLILLKSYVRAHIRRRKDGSVQHIEAHYDKRTKRGVEHAPAHGHDLSHLGDADRELFNKMHAEQHLAHYYHAHAARKQVEHHKGEMDRLEGEAKEHEAAGRDKEAAASWNRASGRRHHMLRHERNLARFNEAIEGIGRLKDKMVAGSGALKDDVDAMHAHYVGKMGAKFKGAPAKRGRPAVKRAKAAETAFTPTHTLPDGTPVVAVPGEAPNVWRDKDGNEYEDDYAEPMGKKDAALQSAIDHLKQDAKQADMPAHERAEDKKLAAKLEGAKEGAAYSINGLTLKKWTHPKTGEVRLYVSGSASPLHKVFIRDGKDKYPDDYPEIVVHSDAPMSRADKDRIIDDVAERAELKGSFKELLRRVDGAPAASVGATDEKEPRLILPVKPASNSAEVDAAAYEAATSPHNNLPAPTAAQIEAGNYKKGHVNVAGLDVTIENPRGSVRSGKRPDGSAWTHTMSDHYGYIKRTTGADGEHVDVYVGPHVDSDKVFVVDQLKGGKNGFDEHKVMLGFKSKSAAVAAYKSNFDKGWKVGQVSEMSAEQFKGWLRDGDTSKPTADAGPQEGERNAEGLVFRDGRWHREGEGDDIDTFTKLSSEMYSIAKQYESLDKNEKDAMRKRAESINDQINSLTGRLTYKHDGLKIYPVATRSGDGVAIKWAAQTPDNAEREAKGERQVGGDGIFSTKEAAEASATIDADRHRKRSEEISDINAAKADSDAKEKLRKEDTYGGFLDAKPEHIKELNRNALEKKVNFGNDGVSSVRSKIDSWFSSGALTVDSDEVDKIKPMTRAQFNRADNRQQQERERRVKAAGKKTVYYVNGYELGKTAHDYAKHLLSSGAKEPLSDDPNSPNYRFKDTGYIAGSRKEKAAESIKQAGRTGQRLRTTDIDWEEIERNPREARELIKKSNLFGKVDWDTLRDGGMGPAAGFLIDRVYASVAAEPDRDSPQKRQDYALGLESLRDRMERCKTPDEVVDVIGEIRDELEGSILTEEQSAQYKALMGIYGKMREKAREAEEVSDAYHKDWRRVENELQAAKHEQEKRTRRGWKPDPDLAMKIEALQPEVDKAHKVWTAYIEDHPELQSKKRDHGDGWTSYENDLEFEASQFRRNADALMRTARAHNLLNNPVTRAWITLGPKFLAVLNYRRAKGSDAFAGHVTNARRGKITDWSWAEKEGATVKKATKREVGFQLKVAEKFERKGGRSVAAESTAQFKDMFGLREVQSGNWVLTDPNSAAWHVQKATEAFADLADLLVAKDEQVSMHGRLAMAFGARGKGNAGFGGAARAHYEGVQRVINITKMGGGGALAHEFAHALDNLCVEAETGKARADDFASENPDLLPAGELRDAFKAVRSAMLDGETQAMERLEYSGSDVKLADYNLNRSYVSPIGQKIKDAGSADAAVNAVDAHFGDFEKLRPKAKKQVKDWRRIAVAYYGRNVDGGSIQVKAGPAMSSFAAEAAALDDGRNPYWSQAREMFARAFQSYCEDKLEDKGRRNDYLSAMADNKYYRDPLFGDTKPFPEGEERVRINAAFDKLIAALGKSGTLAKAAEMFV